MPETAVPEPLDGWRRDLLDAARKLSATMMAGFVTGLLVGGIGSRLAMLILRLTSGPGVQGLESDDGFIIGRISPDSFFLIGLGVVSGLMTALIYVTIRAWFPERLRGPMMAVLLGIVGGSLIVHPDGVDFVVLEPRWLAIALFVVVPAAQGWLTGILVERFLREESRFKKVPAWLALIPILVLAIGGLAGPAILLGAVALWAVNRAQPVFGAVWLSEPVAWLGRTAVAVVTAFATVALVRDAIEIL